MAMVMQASFCKFISDAKNISGFFDVDLAALASVSETQIPFTHLGVTQKIFCTVSDGNGDAGLLLQIYF